MRAMGTWLVRMLVTIAMFCVASAVQAVPIHYTVQFTGDVLLPTSGSFDYDSDLPLFSDFHVVWDAHDFDFTAVANAPVVLPSCGPQTPETSFAFLNHAAPAACGQPNWEAHEGLLTFAEFSFRGGIEFTPIALDAMVGYPCGGFCMCQGECFSYGRGDWTIATETSQDPRQVSLPPSALLLAAGAGFVRYRCARRLLMSRR